MSTQNSETLLQKIQRAMHGEAVEGLRMQFPPPVARLVGFEAVRIERGETVFRMDVEREKHANPMGTLHGGIVCDIADAAMGMACASLLDEGESFTTLELKTNFLRPVFDGAIEARAHVVSAGKTVVYLECEIFSMPGEKLVAKATSTCMILRGSQSVGR